MKQVTKHSPASQRSKEHNSQHAAGAIAVVEFDDKHTESPLCACERCNAAWLARRDQPLSQKHTKHTAPPVDQVNKRIFTARCKALGIEIDLKNEHNMRIAFWRLVDNATGFSYSAGFDADVLALLKRIEERGLTLQGAAADLHAPRDLGPIRSSSAPGNLTGGPFCVVCDCAGGLPCPAMVRDALRLGIKLAYPPGDARLVPNHVHPGRCRKRLKAWIEGGVQAETGKAKALT